MNNKYTYEIGKVYGIKKLISLYRNKEGRLMAIAECVECGKRSKMYASDLMHERTTSCACQRRCSNVDDDPRLYGIWANMKYRCNTPTAHEYNNYGGRGIRVCDEWNKAGGYDSFKRWAYSNGYKCNLTIDRIDSDKDYTPENCQWVTRSENTTRANQSMRVQHRKADKGDYYAIDPTGTFEIFSNANEFSKAHNLCASCVREYARKNKQYKGYLFGYTKDLDFKERQSTIENPERERVEYILGENPKVEAPSMDSMKI